MNLICLFIHLYLIGPIPERLLLNLQIFIFSITTKIPNVIREWWHVSVNLASGKLRQDNCQEFESSLGYIKRPKPNVTTHVTLFLSLTVLKSAHLNHLLNLSHIFFPLSSSCTPHTQQFNIKQVTKSLSSK